MWEEYQYIIIGGIAGGVGVLVVVVLAIRLFFLHRRMSIQSENDGRAECKSVIQKANALVESQSIKPPPILTFVALGTDHPTAIKASDFKKEAERITALSGKAATAYMESVRYKRPSIPDGNAEMKRVWDLEFVKNPETMKNVRHPQYEIIEATQVPVVGQHIKERNHVCLHANLLHDLFGETFIISQAPSEKLFEFQWEMIWQRRIGVVVLLGPFGKQPDRIEPYFGVKHGANLTFGRFAVRTVNTIKYQNLYRMFTISVRNRHIFTTVDLHGQEDRQVFVIHINPWLTVRDPAKVERLALVVEMIRSLAILRKRAGMPSILTHCSTGLEMSATFYAVYLGRQMYLHFNTINVVSILKLIERERYKALSSDAAFQQIQNLYAVLLELIEKHPRPASKGTSQTTTTTIAFEQHLLADLPKHNILASSPTILVRSPKIRSLTQAGKGPSKKIKPTPPPVKKPTTPPVKGNVKQKLKR